MTSLFISGPADIFCNGFLLPPCSPQNFYVTATPQTTTSYTLSATNGIRT
jgi:hypothetical protein